MERASSLNLLTTQYLHQPTYCVYDKYIFNATLILGSDAQLADLIQDFETLRNQYILDFGQPTSSDLRISIEKLADECRRVLRSARLIEDAPTRRRFCAALHKLSTDIIDLTTVKRKVRDVVAKIREGERVNRNRNGFVRDSPRWSQFLDKNAPGASILLLQMRRVLHQKRDAYQLIPRGGVKILQFWDDRLYAMIQAIDLVWTFPTQLLSAPANTVAAAASTGVALAQAEVKEKRRSTQQTQRIEWSHPSMHRLNFGLRTFEPMTFEPSPWNLVRTFTDAILPSPILPPTTHDNKHPTNTPLSHPQLDHATHTFRDVSRFDRRLGALMPRVSSRDEAFQPPDHDDDDDAFDAVLTQRFVKRSSPEDKDAAERKEKADKERRRKMQVVQGEGPLQQQGQQQGESSAAGAAA
uniref:Uncharacterized protein n=1 Tax=Phyllosticta citriasiana TaxID=595635 RepID=A0A866WL48_9PEZI|nr:hypothetical protein [Phyllosticta citriasiana]